MRKVKKIHFMGIGGSACAGVTLMAKKAGFIVSGCDLSLDSPYLAKVNEAGIKVFSGHDASHLGGVDLVPISPAIEFQSNDNPEYIEATEKGILETWDKFVGDYLLKGKEVICIAGTHGKSTTTALCALVFEKAGLDPSSLVGAKVKEWDGVYRIGNSKYFIIESDEFYGKFLNYNPSTIILNNIEFDHPDFFKTEKELFDIYEKFVRLLKNSGSLIINQDSVGNKVLFDRLGPDFLKSINVYGYSLNEKPLFETTNSLMGVVTKRDENQTDFKVIVKNHDFEHTYSLDVAGDHNVQNALGVIILSKIYGLEDAVLAKTLMNFGGIGRRMDFIGEKNGVNVYDDYAHHPTAIKATISAIRQKYPKNRIWVVVEPHSYSRTKALLKEYKGVFDGADKVIVAPIFKARDKETFGVAEEDVVDISGHKDIVYLDDFEKITKRIVSEKKEDDIILVMGAGKSYQLARDILKSL